MNFKQQFHDENQCDSEEFGCRLLNEPTIRNVRNDIERCYTQNWREATKDKILSWAERTQLNSLQQQKRPEITEVIAVLDRLNEILRGGHLRIPEILALLLLGSSNNNQKGNICKIPPREGRATIVAAMLATMKILSGERFVDIITLSPELAEEALQNHWEFY
ncbi:unnamed protein product [Allacma fusca]|uniref:Uncharacterized protein n=1 Tax=Allacma fusca TaxID=39272 RepID=A0A8J2KWV2_9HEXA|nr:unnamed protein product [Allacma fusca]